MTHPTSRAARRILAPKTHRPDTHAQQALHRLEREHVALLLAIAELESTHQDTSSPELRAALLPLLRTDLRRTQYALRRAAAGQYGVCDHCGRQITARALELNPATTRCPACSSRDAKRRGH